jgi:hypothetical protein
MRGRRSEIVAGLAAVAVAVLAGADTSLRAQPAVDDEATPLFERGARLYSKGSYDEAIAEFEKAYQVAPSPILLFNIAQCHRHLGNKERALFFYHRYLEQKPRAPNRADVERHIAELDAAVEEERQANERLAASRVHVVPRPQVVAASEPEPGDVRPPSWVVAAYGAPAWVGFAGRDLDTGSAVLFSATLAGSYVFPTRGPELRVGAQGSFSLLPFTNGDTGGRETSLLWGGLVTGSCLFRASPHLKLGGGGGAGVLWWSGLRTGNPFTVDGGASTGPVPLPTLEVGLRLEYEVERRWFFALAPDLVFSKTTSAGLTEAMSWVTRFDMSVGGGYTF